MMEFQVVDSGPLTLQCVLKGTNRVRTIEIRYEKHRGFRKTYRSQMVISDKDIELVRIEGQKYLTSREEHFVLMSFSKFYQEIQEGLGDVVQSPGVQQLKREVQECTETPTVEGQKEAGV